MSSSFVSFCIDSGAGALTVRWQARNHIREAGELTLAFWAIMSPG